MQQLLDYFRYNKSEAVMMVAFFITLVSIPLSFALVKDSQIFKSRAASLNIPLPTPTQSTLTQVPVDSPLEEIKKLAENQALQATPSASSSTPSSYATSFGPTLSFSVSLEGRPKGKQAGRFFIGIGNGAKTTKPTYLLTFNVDVPDSGVVSGLSLAGLNPGSVYTAYLKGPSQIDKAITFTMTASENSLNNAGVMALTSGDLNEDNTIDANDYNIAKAAYGTTPGSAKWSPRADINADGVINNLDLTVINNNIGKTGDSGVWYSPAPVASSSGTPQGGRDARGGFWMYFPPVD